MLLTSYMVIGLLGGFVGGFLGLGGGIIFVPFLFFTFDYFQINPNYALQSAIVTSLSCVVISSLSALIKHNKNDLVEWDIFTRTLPGIVLGSSLGLTMVTILPTGYIKFIYTVLLVFISIYMFNKNQDYEEQKIKEIRYINRFSIFVGSISSLLGIGGGTLTTPYFNYYGVPIKRCIATASACGVAISLFGILLSFIFTHHSQTIKTNTMELLAFDAFIIVSLSSMLSAYFGASFTKKTEASNLNKIFSVFLILTAISILFY